MPRYGNAPKPHLPCLRLPVHELLVSDVEPFEEVGDEGKLLVVVVVQYCTGGCGQGREQPGCFGLVLPG